MAPEAAFAACHPFERHSANCRLASIDILVHNAGGDIAAKAGKPDPNDAAGIREGDVCAVLDRNLLSTIPDLPGGGKGDDAAASGPQVTIGSVAAFKGRTNGSIYAVAKAGMTHYTRCLADQLRAYDIMVNCIAPGELIGTRAVEQDRMVETGTLDRIATVEESSHPSTRHLLDSLSMYCCPNWLLFYYDERVVNPEHKDTH